MIDWKEKQKVSVKTLFGLEEMLKEELIALGVEDVRVGNRIVFGKVDLEGLYRVNLQSRLALRVLIDLFSFKVKNEEDLFLNEEDPHLEHTIFPPKDRSETNEELPQLKQTLFTLI